MQDRYVGDVGDFAKYALLRCLAGVPSEQPIRLGILWYLVSNESHNGDGRHIAYLDNPGFADLDDALRSALARIVGSGIRSVSEIVKAGILPPETVFCDSPISPGSLVRFGSANRINYRREWLAQCLVLTEHCDLIFFDPDNGLEIKSVPRPHPKAGKYVFWDEIKPFWKRGQSLLIYHHLNRTKPAATQVVELTKKMKAEFPDSVILPLIFRRGSCRVFWIVSPKVGLGATLELRASKLLGTGWSKHFWPLGRIDGARVPGSDDSSGIDETRWSRTKPIHAPAD